MTDVTPDGGEFIYSYKASVIGAGWSFRLTPAGIAWDNGRRSGVTAYRDISKVRMTYKPASLQSHRFVTQIWAAGKPALTIVSTSWQGIFNQQANSSGYSAFVRELHRRIAASGNRPQLQAGVHPIVYAAGVLFVAVVVLAMIGLVVRAARGGTWGSVAALIGLFAMFGWSGSGFFRRNWPQSYRADAPPAALMPD